jgi:hypothetical protein
LPPVTAARATAAIIGGEAGREETEEERRGVDKNRRGCGENCVVF